MSVSMGVDYPSITVEIGIATSANPGTGLWDSTVWDTATWGPDFAWADVSAYVRSLETFRGRSRESERYQTGTASLLLDNTDGRFTPANTAGPYVDSGGVSKIRPRVPVRITATWDSQTYPLFYGRAEGWRDHHPQQGFDALTELSVVDGLAELAAFDGAEQSEQGGGESSGQRIHRILNNIGWILDRDVDVGTVAVQATTLAQNAFSEAALTADSEGGALWAAPDGSIVFDDRLALLENSRSNTSQVSFGVDVLVRDVVVEYSSDTLRNIVSLARAGGEQITVSDIDSIALYGERAWARNDLICATDAPLTALALFSLASWKDPEYRVVEVTVHGARLPQVHWPQVLGRRLRDRASVTAEVHVSGVTITQPVFIDGVAHSIRPRDWSTQFFFGSATLYDSFTTSRWDEGVWDTATWFF